MTPTHTPLRRKHARSMVCGTAFAASVAALMVATPAYAQQFTLHAEGAAAFWLDNPQGERFTPGGYLAVRPGVTLGRIVSFQMSYAMLGTAHKDPYTEPGVAHFVTGGLRLRPFATLRPESENLGGFWIDGNAGYVRTGEFNRFGFDTGLGYNFQAAPWLALGPVVRYAHIVQPDHLEGRDPNDAQFLTAGINLTFGTPYKEPIEEEEEEQEEHVCPQLPAEKECPPAVVIVQPPAACADRDTDGVCDVDDRCPTLAGSAATFGCPVDPCTGLPLVVLVQFDYDSSKMPVLRTNDPQTMDPVLDAVAAAIAQNPTCRVCIVGHASDEGSDDYNMTLSRQRAAAVQGYMTARGVTKSKIPTTGLGEQCQMVPEQSYELNRRVDFYRLDDGESCPTDCTPK